MVSVCRDNEQICTRDLSGETSSAGVFGQALPCARWSNAMVPGQSLSVRGALKFQQDLPLIIPIFTRRLPWSDYGETDFKPML